MNTIHLVICVLCTLLCATGGARAAPIGKEILRRRLPTEAGEVDKDLKGYQSSPVEIIETMEKTLQPKRPNHGRVAAPVVQPNHNNDDVGDLENEMKYEQGQDQKKEMEEIEKIEKIEEEDEAGQGNKEAYGRFVAYYKGALTMAGGLANLVVISTGFFLIGLMVCIAAFDDPCGCENYLLLRLIDQDSLMVVVEEEEGERIGLLQHDQMDRSDLYKTNEQSYVYIQRENEIDDYGGIV